MKIESRETATGMCRRGRRNHPLGVFIEDVLAGKAAPLDMTTDLGGVGPTIRQSLERWQRRVRADLAASDPAALRRKALIEASMAEDRASHTGTWPFRAVKAMEAAEKRAGVL